MSDFTLTTKIYFSALYFWTHVFYYCSLLFTNILWFVITYTPDSFIIYKIPFLKCKTDEINIIEAQLVKTTNTNKTINKIDNKTRKQLNKQHKNKTTQKNTDITNVIKLLINIYWDKDINSMDYVPSDKTIIADGGIDLEKIFDAIPEFNDSIIWIKYIRDFHNIFKEVVPNDVQKLIDTSIHHILIDSRCKGDSLNDKNGKQYDIYKNNDLKKNYKNIFNELSF